MASSPSITYSQAQQYCRDVHPAAHLVAINTEEEHNYLRNYLQEGDRASCECVRTAGKAYVQGSPDKWYWEIGAQKQNVTYFDWANGQPTNTGGQENTLMMFSFKSYKFGDTAEDVSTRSWYASKVVCNVCEVHP